MIQLHKRTGVPMNANDWTEQDWRDLHEAIDSATKKIAARHDPLPLPPKPSSTVECPEPMGKVKEGVE